MDYQRIMPRTGIDGGVLPGCFIAQSFQAWNALSQFGYRLFLCPDFPYAMHCDSHKRAITDSGTIYSSGTLAASFLRFKGKLLYQLFNEIPSRYTSIYLRDNQVIFNLFVQMSFTSAYCITELLVSFPEYPFT